MKTCRRCGCIETMHLHHRVGSDCGHCGHEVCPSFKPLRWYHRKRKAEINYGTKIHQAIEQYVRHGDE